MFIRLDYFPSEEVMNAVLYLIFGVVCTVIAMLILWVASWFDYRRLNEAEREHRLNWIQRWNDYRAQHPDTSLSAYTKDRERQNDPLWLPTNKMPRELERVFVVLIATFLVVTFYCFWKAIEVREGYDDAVVIVPLIMLVLFVCWLCLVLEDVAVPGWARSSHRYKGSEMPEPHDPQFDRR